MKFSAAAFVIAAVLVPPPLLAAKCKVVVGVFQLWNGWPPSLRLKDKKSGIIYGVNEDTHIPKVMRRAVTRNGRVVGKFCLVVVGRTTVPYQKEPIFLVRVTSYSH